MLMLSVTLCNANIDVVCYCNVDANVVYYTLCNVFTNVVCYTL